ncbi:MAG: hypothetical protein LUQ25_09820 [Methanoregulaceae archaeon]|nr:hypothetical protein [Methanoregulaceae archaeon]
MTVSTCLAIPVMSTTDIARAETTDPGPDRSPDWKDVTHGGEGSPDYAVVFTDNAVVEFLSGIARSDGAGVT